MSIDDRSSLGAVAYDPKVVTIWEGFTDWFADQDFAFDYVLYSNYERQAEAHLAGAVDVTWDSPLAWVRTRRLAAAAGPRGPGRRDARHRPGPHLGRARARRQRRSPTSPASPGGTVATGAVDSPQATLLPLAHLAGAGLDPGSDFAVRRFDVMVGKHGDHVGGERDAVPALVGRRGRRRLRDRRQPAGVRPGGHDPGRRGARPRPDRALRPLHHDRPRRRRRRRPSSGSSSCCCRCRTTIPAVRPLLELEGLKRVAARPHRRATTSSRRPSTGSASTAPTARSSPTATGRDGGRRPSSSVTSGSTAAPTSSSSWPSPSAPPASDVVVRGTHPDLARPPRGVVPPAGTPRGVAVADGPPACTVERRARRRRGVAVGVGAAAGRCRPARRRRPPARRLGARRPRRARRGRRAGAALRASTDRDDGLDRRGPAALRPGRGRAVGPGDGDRLDARRSTDRRRRRGRRRAGDDVPDREREGRAGRAGPLPRPGPPALPRDPAAARRHVADEARHIEVFTRRAPLQRRPLGAVHAPAAGPRCRRCSTSPTSRPRRSCCRCWARARSSSLLGFLERHAPDP